MSGIWVVSSQRNLYKQCSSENTIKFCPSNGLPWALQLLQILQILVILEKECTHVTLPMVGRRNPGSLHKGVPGPSWVFFPDWVDCAFSHCHFYLECSHSWFHVSSDSMECCMILGAPQQGVSSLIKGLPLTRHSVSALVFLTTPGRRSHSHLGHKDGEAQTGGVVALKPQS